MKKSFKRTPAQADYFKRNPRCRICGRPAEHVHHIDQNRRNDSDDNLECLCAKHHVLDKGVHTMGVVVFCEWFWLTKDKKWVGVYEKFKSKKTFNLKIGEVWDASTRGAK